MMITRYIYPLWLREKLSYRFRRFVSGKNLSHGTTGLYFSPNTVMQLKPTDFGHQSIILNGFYELALSKWICRLAKEGGLLVDVGANYGYFSLLWLAQNRQNKCIAFEAAPDNLSPLRENLIRNQVSDRAKVEPCALADKSGSAPFLTKTSNGQTGWGGLAKTNSQATIMVPVNTLDAYFQEQELIGEIAVLKIDVEGADALVLLGAQKLLRQQRIKHIFYEVNPTRMEALGVPESLAPELLKRYGYRIEQIDKHEFHASCL